MSHIVFRPSSPDQEPVRFSTGFTIGRAATCGLHVDHHLASRVHAAVSLEDDGWWIVDLGSTNGVFLNGEKVDRGSLSDGVVLQVGRGGERFTVVLPDSQALAATHFAPKTSSQSGAAPILPPHDPTDLALESSEGSGSSSVDHTVKKYFSGAGEEGGAHTQLIRAAYQEAKTKDRRPFVAGIGALLLLVVIAGATLMVQRARVSRLEEDAEALFLSMRETDLLLANFRRVLETNGGVELEAQLAGLAQQREGLKDTYEGYIEQLGFYRRLRNERERAIYRTARVFGESEFSMSGGFARAVEDEIEAYWMGPGRSRFSDAVERSRTQGATAHIGERLTHYGLPVEFFYLALQESDMKSDAVGPSTRYGRAKGMWQFIPSTAARYGLDPGPRPNTAETTYPDDRLDYRLATDAAARYLRDLHAELAQGSGLLVMAAYNWGEHRVGPRLQNLDSPDQEFGAEFEDVGQSPNERSYWRFLEEYGSRMPEQTREYVIRIFAAAVLGTHGEAFGWDGPDPLAEFR